ncbi:hypothetical protein F5J12DRAFT_1940 [Pisolithus orientalis]|uniref:uncharacterized protein n=1 Tax=Pisolithus orientalis TaxID=936130 RepID=UPI002224DAE5|nr:uncharacterized protein F5J12DRAFT_1940 [Pisolithus orientalis]KAI6034867.1 hypothetical protein F5J12DRAFT_1940 [Pisolithus orientalis]
MGVLFIISQCLAPAIIVLDLKSTSGRVLGCSLVVALIAADMAISRTGTGFFDYTFGSTLGTDALDAIQLLLLTQPLKNYCHEANKVPAHRLPYVERFFWIMSAKGHQGGHSRQVNQGVPVEPHQIV